MSVPAPIANVLPAAFTESLDKAFITAQEYVTKVKDVYGDAEGRVITQVKNFLPESTHSVAEKVVQALPETLVTTSMITGSFTLFATIYGAARTIWAAAPVIKAALNGKFDAESMTAAKNESLDRINQIYKNFLPAIFIACAVGAVASGVLGVLSISPTLVMKGGFLSMVSFMAHESMQAKQAVVADAATPQETPTPTTKP
jgi:hypothetical protein